MGLLFDLSASNGSEAACGQGEEFIEESGFAIVSTVVVGDRDQIKTGGKQTIVGAGSPRKVYALGTGSPSLEMTHSRLQIVRSKRRRTSAV